MTSLIKLVLCLAGIDLLLPLQAAVLPSGSTLEVRLLHGVGSRISHLGEPVEATVISPFFIDDELAIPAGVTISGRIEHLERLGFGLRHTAARLDIRFTQLHLLDGSLMPFDGLVSTVENSREIVRPDGVVMGINPTANFSTGVSAVFTVLNMAEREFRLPIVAFKLLAARSPDAEISFPAGTEMVLRVERSVSVPASPNRTPEIPLLSVAQIQDVQNLLGKLPAQQTNRSHDRPSDLVNILVLGNKDQLTGSFHAAGWGVPESHGVMAVYHMFHCAVERKTNSHLPMSTLKLNGNLPDAAFEKSLDTFAKRHHVRFWYDEKTNAWLGAATEDTGYKWQNAHLTHASDSSIDNERAKVVNDLAFTGCVDKGALIPRDSLKPVYEAGSSIQTDGDIAVLQLNACETPRGMPTDPQKPVPVRAVQILMAVGVDFARSNPVSVGYALTKSIFEAGSMRKNLQFQSTRAYIRPSAVANASAPKADGALATR